MILTEAEAKTKWCPQVRHDVQSNNCSGSACMMFRWAETEREIPYRLSHWPEDESEEATERMRTTEPLRPESLPDDWVWTPVTGEGVEITGGYWEEPEAEIQVRVAEAARRGYCGLAGKP